MPMDPRDKPIKHESLQKLITLLENAEDPKDWNNLPSFLEGMMMAKEPLPAAWLEKVVRKANERGMTSVIVRCAQMVKKTGLTLSNRVVTEELMLGLHFKAVNANWEGFDALKALKEAEVVINMMEDWNHCGGKLKKGQQDLRRSVSVMGVLMELAAGRALHVDGGKDVHGKILNYARKTLAMCEPESFIPGNQVYDATHDLERWLPLWAGVKMALKIDNVDQSDLASALRDQLGRLDNGVNKARDTVVKDADGKPRRCLKMYDQLKSI